MDFGYVLNFMYEFAYLLGVFAFFLVFAIFKGRQATINVTFGLYLALLISNEFPNYDRLFSGFASAESLALAKLGFFVFITLFTTMLCYRVMPSEFRETRFESIGKKLILALGATILVMTFSFQVLPISEFLTPGTPLQSLFGPEPYFFWWLLVPMVILYIV
ncbi:MAG: hypothetical protein KBC62_00680 [Candidatus Pacebacteria bacterium]|jgi:uncharacterized membrane protein|nr:hypothetical protein [Candidatus Paceibacterota bacterium]